MYIIMCETTHSNMKKIELLVCIYEIPRELVFIWDFWSFWMEQSIWVFTCVATGNNQTNVLFPNPLEQIGRCWQWVCCKNLQAVADWKGSFAGRTVGKWCIWPWKSRRLIFFISFQKQHFCGRRFFQKLSVALMRGNCALLNNRASDLNPQFVSPVAPKLSFTHGAFHNKCFSFSLMSQ